MNRDTYSETGDWIADVVRSKPEALLLLAAGCALLLRGSGSASASNMTNAAGAAMSNAGGAARDQADALHQQSSRATQGLYRAAESATEYASDVKDRVSDAASSYVQSAADYAEDARRNISAQSERLTRQAQSAFEMIREQPLAVAALGLAAGAAVAALFPTTQVERRTLGAAREAIKEAAGKTGETLMEAAGEAGEKLKEGAVERGLNPEGIKELAREVADTFTKTAAGSAQPGQSAGPSTGQRNPGAGFDRPLDDRRKGGQ